MDQTSDNAEDFGDSDQLDRVHELSWGLLDDRLNGDEMAEFEALLKSDPTARESYIRCANARRFGFLFCPAAPTRAPLQSRRC